MKASASAGSSMPRASPSPSRSGRNFSMPRDPLFPALQPSPRQRPAGRDAPTAISGAPRQKQIPSNQSVRRWGKSSSWDMAMARMPPRGMCPIFPRGERECIRLRKTVPRRGTRMPRDPPLRSQTSRMKLTRTDCLRRKRSAGCLKPRSAPAPLSSSAWASPSRTFRFAPRRTTGTCMIRPNCRWPR